MTKLIEITSTGVDDLDVLLFIREALKLLPISQRRVVLEYALNYHDEVSAGRG